MNNKKNLINYNKNKEFKYINKIIAKKFMISQNNTNYDYLNFSEEEDDNDGLIDWIKDHKAATIILGVGTIVFIALIILVILCAIKMNKKIKSINNQINKISFKNDDLRNSNIIEDDLLI